jgi:hypothetical protein
VTTDITTTKARQNPASLQTRSMSSRTTHYFNSSKPESRHPHVLKSAMLPRSPIQLLDDATLKTDDLLCINYTQ